MNLKTLRLFFALILLSGLYLVACSKKDNKGDDGDGKISAENNAFAEAQYNDVTTMVDGAAVTGNATFGAVGTNTGNGTLGAACATVTLDTVSNPHAITIDFGTANCMCIDGRNRRGKIMASYTGHYQNSGTVIAITFDNYFVDDNKIDGTKTITNQGLNNSGNLVYKVEVNGQIVRANNGGTATWISTRYREWKEGAGTPLNILDDVYAITGTASGTNVQGKAYTITITQELIRKMNCRWFESGKLSLTQGNLPAITLDYGSTGCDANAVVSFAGTDYPVVLQ